MKLYTAIPINSKIPREGIGEIHYFENIEDDSAARKYNRIIEAFLGSSCDILNIHHHDCEVRCPEKEVLRQWQVLQASDVQVAGVIGTLCLFPSLQWWQPQRPVVTAGAIIQGYGDGQERAMLDMPGMRTDMVSVDGCCLWLSRKVLEEGLRLSEDIPGWHLYDVDICLRCLQMGHKVGLLNAQVKHDSEGHFDPATFEEVRKIAYDRWSKAVDFPVVSGVSKWTK